MLFGLLATLAQCGRLSERGLGDDSSSSSSNEDGNEHKKTKEH